MQKTETVQIDGDEYELTQLGALEGRKILTKLLHLLGPSLQELAAAETLNEKAIAAALAKALETLDEATLEQLCDAFGKKSTVTVADKKPALTGAIFDQHFAGRYLAMMKWLVASMRLNFLDFLDAAQLEQLKNLPGLAKATPK
jgi:hypothetical protein